MVILVTDRIYTKTRRYLHKVRKCIGEALPIYLACVSGFPDGLPLEFIRDFVPQERTICGSLQYITDEIKHLSGAEGGPLLLALNQSSILPAIALERLLGFPPRAGLVESCDKRIMRRVLSQYADLAVQYSEITPGSREGDVQPFEAAWYVVKPAFGMSSNDVRIFSTWNDAESYAKSITRAKEWVPADVAQVLRLGRTDTRIIEEFIDGTEFSIDGWVYNQRFYAIVQHKLKVFQRTPDGDRPTSTSLNDAIDRWSFIGDGPTVSPPLKWNELPNSGCAGLLNEEDSICRFGRRLLTAIGLTEGVFHIEGRERRSDARLFPIEINPRAPGGSLWKSALLRSGFDLEAIHVLIQLHKQVVPQTTETKKHVLHYPFYANNPGVLEHWGDLANFALVAAKKIEIDIVARIGDRFCDRDMCEEPYLAFAVAHDDNVMGLLSTCEAILAMNPPQIKPFSPDGNEH